MKIQDLRRIIKEEIAKVLAESPQPTIAPPKTTPKTPIKPSRIGRPDVKPNPKAVSENEKDIVDKITKRYAQNKKK